MKPLKRIICVGNRFRPEDSAGPMVYDHLLSSRIPKGVEVIDGGLAGLNLLRFFDNAVRVVLIDAVKGFRSSGGVFTLTVKDAGRHADAMFGHNAGLAYCLRVLPEVHEGKLPEIFIVGIQGPPKPDKISKAAGMSLEIAAQEIK
ncbi:MAG: hydrogenase maturation protease [Desulfobacterales bacterium]